MKTAAQRAAGRAFDAARVRKREIAGERERLEARLGAKPLPAFAAEMLIDGHLRVETSPDSEVPVLILPRSVQEFLCPAPSQRASDRQSA